MKSTVYRIKCTAGVNKGQYIKKISGGGYIEFGKRAGTCKLWTSLSYVELAFDKCESYVEKCKFYNREAELKGEMVSKRVDEGAGLEFVIEEI